MQPAANTKLRTGELVERAIAFVEQYAEEHGWSIFQLRRRRDEIVNQVTEQGTYHHTFEELVFGARVAWRNHSRCIGRLYWQSLIVRDCRQIRRTDDILQALHEHIRIAFNGGVIQSVVSIFAPCEMEADHPFRLRNPQLFRYAGYEQCDGTVLGDPLNLSLTDEALRLGWQPGTRTSFDVLPWIFEDEGIPRFHSIPEHLVHEVPIVHPHLPWFAEFGLRWHALPVVSDMSLEIGGLTYPLCPFNGWYMGTEIASRNFADETRYNVLRRIAEGMSLNMRHEGALWRDRALVELNAAVLHSFHVSGVRIVDHHTASNHFMKHIERERCAGRSVPADWSWIVPPMSSSATKVFHLEMEDGSPAPRFVRKGQGSEEPGQVLSSPRGTCPHPRHPFG
jgi:nitric-oxide synthase